MKNDVSSSLEELYQRQMDENHSTKDNPTTTPEQRLVREHNNNDHDDDDDEIDHYCDEEILHQSLLLRSSSSSPFDSVVGSDCLTTTHHHHNNNTMPFLTTTAYEYSMVSTPRNTNSPTMSYPNHNHTILNHPTTAGSTSCSSSTYHLNHPNHKSCIGLMVCFVLALSLPIAYQQYTLEERNYYNVVLVHPKSKPDEHHSTNNSIVPTHPQPTIIIVTPQTPYIYPTLEKHNQEEDEDDDQDDDHVNDDDTEKEKDHDDATILYNLPKIAWLMSFPGSLGISHIIHSMEWYSQTTTATNYGATLLYPQREDDNNDNDDDTATSTITNASQSGVVVNPIYSVQPNDQCGPFLHRWDLPLPTSSSYIVTNTFCSTAQTTSSSVVCTECIPKYHNLLTFERACATGNRLYEQHYRSVQYDTRIPVSYIQVIQNPFTTLINRLRITFQQKIRMAQYNDVIGHSSDYFLPYQSDFQVGRTTNRPISMVEYCHYLDTTYATLATTDLLENYTHVPCHSEFYKYIQWYNDAVTLTTIKYNSNNNNKDDNSNDDDDDDDSMNKPVHYIYYEKYLAALLNQPNRQKAHPKHNDDDDDDVQDLLDFLNLTKDSHPKRPVDDASFYDSIVHESSLSIWNETSLAKYFPISILQNAADMIYELALPATWELLRHYLEPYVSVNQKNPAHYHLHWAKHKHEDRPQSIPMSLIYDTKIPDDSMILSPLLFDDYRNTLYENPFREHDASLLHPPEPNDPNPQVVWLLSFPNSGTSYTINNLEVTCNVTTGSNYAKDWEVIVPVRPEFVNGPFIHNTELRVPHYVLTKTHCFGYCDDCGPSTYNITNNKLFEQGCVRAEMTNHTGSVRYENTVPVKAVHLYRSPFDNIVARMHLAVHKRQRQGNDVSLFTNSQEGLSSWCQYLDEKYSAEEEEFFSPTLLQLFRHVPCHADWYRYVQWHNHAYIMTEKLNLTVYDLFYEDYSHDYDRTLSTLFHYLDVTPKQSSIDFYVGKSYESFFDVDHARNAAILVHAISIPPVWLRLRHYFEDYM